MIIKHACNYRVSMVIPLITVLLLILLSPSSWAHPHTFIEVEIKVVFEENGLKGLQVEWLFDYMTAVNIKSRFDTNSDMKLDAQEIAVLRDESFYNLVRFNYYTDIKVDHQAIATPRPTNFELGEPGDRMVYSFFVPLDAVTDSRTRLLSVSVYDKEFYCDMELKQNVVLENTGTIQASLDYKKDKTRAYYFGQIIPMAVNIRINSKG